MMNRGVLARQMFAQGGAAVPNEYKGFSKLPENVQMKMDPVAAEKYAEGGDVAMEQGLGSMVQAPPMPAQESVDPAIMQDMLMRAGEGIQDLENVDNYEQMMNMIRGDEASVPERRTELAGLVGEQDAAQTPESVLALVQPVVQIASVDEGIGGLAQETMTEPVEGPMAEGIMSTMAPPPPDPAMMGGPPPANFKDGGLVRRGDNQPVKMMQAGGDPFKTAPGRLGELARERMAVRQGLLGDPEGRLQEQKDLTQAQMLFDVANTALAFAAPMEGERPGMSAAERLAMAARTTQLPQTIGARAAQLGEFKSGLGKEKQALQLAALGSAETALAAEAEAAAELKKEEVVQAGAISRIKLSDKLNLKTQTALTNLGLSGKLKLAEVGQGFAIDLENLRNTNQLSRDEYNAAKKEELLLVQQEGQEALATLQGQIDFKSRTDLQKQAATISKELETVKSNLRVQEKGVDLENQLDIAGVKQAYEIERMGVGLDKSKALADHNAVIANAAQEDSQAFQAAQSALDRVQRENLQLSDQTFKQLMQEEMQKFTSDQSEIDRAIAKSQRDIENSFASRGIDIKLDQISINKAAQALDEQYKLGKLAIDEAAQNSTQLGSKAKTATLKYISNNDRLSLYASGQLGDETTQFEQTVMDYLNPDNNKVWDVNLGVFVQGTKPQLVEGIEKAIKQGNPAFYARITGKDAPKETDKVVRSIVSTEAPETLADATKELLNPDGTVNLESEAWSLTKPTRFNSDIDYAEAIGASRVFPSIYKAGSEGLAEFTGQDTTQDSKNLAEAQKTLDALANDLLRFNTNPGDGRVLKFVQELIERETSNLRPGGMFLKTDADARASLKALTDGLSLGIQKEAKLLPEYGGSASGYSTSQVTQAREGLNRMKILLNEVLAFNEAFDYNPKKITNAGSDQSTGTAKSQILNMRKNKQEGEN